jgi:hypothetical protein
MGVRVQKIDCMQFVLHRVQLKSLSTNKSFFRRELSCLSETSGLAINVVIPFGRLATLNFTSKMATVKDLHILFRLKLIKITLHQVIVAKDIVLNAGK